MYRTNLCQILGLLLAGSDVQDTCSTGHDQNAKDGEHQGAVITGFGQIKSTGIDHGQRCQGVYGAVFAVMMAQFLKNVIVDTL